MFNKKLTKSILIISAGLVLIFISAILFLVLNLTVIKRYMDESSFKKRNVQSEQLIFIK